MNLVKGIVQVSLKLESIPVWSHQFNLMFCDRMDVEKPQRVPLSVFRHCETLARPGAPLGPFLVCNFFKKNFSKNFRFSTFVKEYLTLGSLFAIFEPWIWRRLGPVPACLLSQGNLQNRTCLNGPPSGFFSALCDFFSKFFQCPLRFFLSFASFQLRRQVRPRGQGKLSAKGPPFRFLIFQGNLQNRTGLKSPPLSIFFGTVRLFFRNFFCLQRVPPFIFYFFNVTYKTGRD